MTSHRCVTVVGYKWAFKTKFILKSSDLIKSGCRSTPLPLAKVREVCSPPRPRLGGQPLTGEIGMRGHGQHCLLVLMKGCLVTKHMHHKGSCFFLNHRCLTDKGVGGPHVDLMSPLPHHKPPDPISSFNHEQPDLTPPVDPKPPDLLVRFLLEGFLVLF